MKKIVSMLLVLAMIMGIMVGCGAKEDPVVETPPAETPAETPAEAPEETPAETPEEAPAETPAATRGDGEYVIGICLNNITNPFRVADFNAGVTWFDVPEHSNWSYVYTAAANDITTQIADMEDLIAQGVDAICINCMNEDAMAVPLQMAEDAGIPVIAWDRAITNTAFRDGVVKKDNYTNYYNLGLEVVEDMGGEGKAVMLLNQAGNAVTEEAYAGYMDAFKDAGANIEIVNLSYCTASRSEAINIFESVYLANPDVDAILTEGDEVALGAIQVLQANGAAPGDVFVYGHDGQKEALEAVIAGWMTCTAMNPMDMLYQAIEMAAVCVLEGAPKEEFIITPTIPVDSSNVDQYYDPDSVF